MGRNCNWLLSDISRMDGGTLYGAIHFHNRITMSAASPTFKKFNTLAQQSIASVSKNIIVKKKDTYEVFGKYRIRKQEDGFVVYNKDQRVNTFLSSRNALSYCIFEKYFKYEDSKLLERLDGRLQSKLFDIEVAHHILTTSQDSFKKFNAMARVELYIDETKNIKEQINEVVNKAKYFQQRELDNEVNRHTTKNRR